MSSKYYTMEFIVNDVVYILFSQKFEALGIDSDEGYFKVMGHDHIGLWLQHPGIVKIDNKDDKGNSIPKDKRKKEVIDGVFLVPWGGIRTMMHFPDREGFDFPGVLDKDKIGFRNKK